jgi:hypothetical protein
MDEQRIRRDVLKAKGRRNIALLANVTADTAGEARPYSDADMAALQLDIDLVAYEARSAGVYIDDLVGRSVGRLHGGS